MFVLLYLLRASKIIQFMKELSADNFAKNCCAMKTLPLLKYVIIEKGYDVVVCRRAWTRMETHLRSFPFMCRLACMHTQQNYAKMSMMKW